VHEVAVQPHRDGPPGEAGADLEGWGRRAAGCTVPAWRRSATEGWRCFVSSCRLSLRRRAAITAVRRLSSPPVMSRNETGVKPDPDEQAIRGQALKLLDQDCEVFARGGYAEGRGLDLAAALSLAAGADRARHDQAGSP
jgi:hypothetical protein